MSVSAPEAANVEGMRWSQKSWTWTASTPGKHRKATQLLTKFTIARKNSIIRVLLSHVARGVRQNVIRTTMGATDANKNEASPKHGPKIAQDRPRTP